MTLLLILLALPPVAWLALYVQPKFKGDYTRTPVEVLVRVLHFLSVWFQSLAEGMDSGILAYRDRRWQANEAPHCESFRPWISGEGEQGK